MSCPLVTLLLPNRNNGPVLDLTLARLLEHTTYPTFELVVVDDGSTDESRGILRRWRDEKRFRDFTLIERDHRGVVAALNAGLAAASGELIVQLDGDATVETPGWLERMVDFLQSDPCIGVVNPLITFDNGHIHAAGVNVISELGLHDRASRPNESTGQRTVNTLVQRFTVEEAGPVAQVAGEVDAGIGVCMLYRRAVAEEVGGYDPGFSPVWFDDVDLSLSMRLVGLKVFFLPDVRFVHRIDLRNDRRSQSDARRLRQRLRTGTGQALPQSLKDRLIRIERRNTPHPPHELRRLRHHYAYWREKWGFDLMNPNMPEVLNRYGSTEVCWAYDPARRSAGEQIIEGWSSLRSP